MRIVDQLLNYLLFLGLLATKVEVIVLPLVPVFPFEVKLSTIPAIELRLNWLKVVVSVGAVSILLRMEEWPH